MEAWLTPTGERVFLRGARVSGRFDFAQGQPGGGAPRVTLENELLVWELAEGRLDLDLAWDEERARGRLSGELTGARFRLLRRLTRDASPDDPSGWALHAPDVPWCLDALLGWIQPRNH